MEVMVLVQEVSKINKESGDENKVEKEEKLEGFKPVDTLVGKIGKPKQNLNKIYIATAAVIILIIAILFVFSFMKGKSTPIEEEHIWCGLEPIEKCCTLFIDEKEDKFGEQCQDQMLFITNIILKNKPKLCKDYKITSRQKEEGTDWLIANQEEICNKIYDISKNPEKAAELNNELVEKCLADTGLENCRSLDIKKNTGLIIAHAVKNKDVNKCLELQNIETQEHCKAVVMDDISFCSKCLQEELRPSANETETINTSETL